MASGSYSTSFVKKTGEVQVATSKHELDSVVVSGAVNAHNSLTKSSYDFFKAGLQHGSADIVDSYVF